MHEIAVAEVVRVDFVRDLFGRWNNQAKLGPAAFHSLARRNSSPKESKKQDRPGHRRSTCSKRRERVARPDWEHLAELIGRRAKHAPVVPCVCNHEQHERGISITTFQTDAALQRLDVPDPRLELYRSPPTCAVDHAVPRSKVAADAEWDFWT